MGCEPDQWAKDWLEEQRAQGKTGLTVEKRGDMHIVKWATTKWDPETKKRKKISEYRGVLHQDGTLAPPRPQWSRVEAAQIVDSGNARLLARFTEPILPALKFAFPNDYPEIVELAVTRILGRGELCKAGRCWNRLEDVLGLRPNTSPKSLSDTLERVGLARGSQDLFFSRLEKEDSEMAVDMSVIFSKVRGATMLKTGYNRFRLSCPQFNLVMCCGLASGRPRYMRVVPGNMKEGCAVTMLDEFDIEEGTLLVMDRGYHDKKLLAAIRGEELDYLVAVKRNSKVYEKTDAEEGIFRWRDSAVRYGHSRVSDGEWAYRFENLDHRNDELVDALRAQELGHQRDLKLDKAGNFVMVSSREMDPRDVYRIYKARCSIEDFFDSAKNVLSADRTYMRDDAHVMGHLFITFVAALVRYEVARLIDEADLASSYSPEDVLDVYATMKIVTGDAEIRQLVPKDVKDLDAKLGVFLYSTQDDRDKLMGIKKKRGRKPKASGPSS